MINFVYNSLSPVWFVFWCTFVGCFLLAGHNLLKKIAINKRELWQGRDAAFTGLIFGWAAIILFLVTAQSGGPGISTTELSFTNGFWIPVLLTGLLNIAIQFANTRALAQADASLVVPIASSTPAIVIVISLILLGEHPTVWGWLGVWLMASGAYLLQIQDAYEKLFEKQAGKPRWRRWLAALVAPFVALQDNIGVRWAFGAALLAAISLNYDGLVARHANVPFGVGLTFAIAALGNLIFALLKNQFNPTYRVRMLLATFWPGLLVASSQVVFSWAFRAALVPYVGSLKRLAIPLLIIGSYFLLGERKRFLGRFLGGTVMVIGAILIAIGISAH